jgi:predicted nuclease of predicted toxin-antitoxin system
MKFLVDNQLPPALAAHLRHRGHECSHVIDLGLDESDDVDLWRYCAARQIALISKDEDFMYFAARPDDTGRLVWVRLGNCRNGPLIEAFDQAHDGILLAFESGQRIVELRS